MEPVGAAASYARLSGAVRRLDSDDNDVVEFVLFVCETLAKHDPSIGLALTKAARQRLQTDFPDGPYGHIRPAVVQEKLRHGLREIVRRADP